MLIPPEPDPKDPKDASATLVLRRTFAASRERVFRAWITPGALEAWFRPRGQSMTVHALDARVGGSFHFELENGNAIVGSYLQFVPPEKLAFTWSGEAASGRRSVVTLDFIDKGDQTEVVLTHEGLKPEIRARAEGGWPSMLDTLAALLASPWPDV
ncbi:MAG TPA: SRPBCC domain-containing protein [Ktedonobacterales bacterium]|nr:SRPBCC domain-containing protein [Ktedonobacterales bacterium]